MMAATFKACSLDGCNGNAATVAQGALGYCRAHYSRFRRYGDPLAGRAAPGSPPKPCTAAGCANSQSGGGQGFCNKHYLRFRKYGNTLETAQDRHGMARTRLYNIWKGMRGRCGHKKGTKPVDAKNYRDKGIRICAEWLRFPAFAEWALANGYTDSLTIDRIDSGEWYQPSNCRWVTLSENSRAASRQKLTAGDAAEIRKRVAGGEAVASIAAAYGVDPTYIRRIRAGKAWAS